MEAERKAIDWRSYLEGGHLLIPRGWSLLAKTTTSELMKWTADRPWRLLAEPSVPFGYGPSLAPKGLRRARLAASSRYQRYLETQPPSRQFPYLRYQQCPMT